MFTRFDFVAIGDVTVDAFIRLKDASVHCDIDHRNCQLCVNFADKIPYESVHEVAGVGNSANAAVSAARLGLHSALVAHVGADLNGKKCLDSLHSNRVSLAYVQSHRNFPTNYHYVLWYEDERTILVKHQDYPYKLPRLKKPRYIYLSSLAPHSYEYHLEIIKFLKENPETKLAFQPGTFQISLGIEKLQALYQLADTFFCNVEEARRILNDQNCTIKQLLIKMRAAGPRIVAITDGPAGSYAYDGNTAYYMPIYPDPQPPIQRTGAGDAFASTFVSALAQGKTFEQALMWAPVNPMNVVQHIGAQAGLLNKEQIEELLSKAPVNYKPKVI